jgi:hypothetical protein
MKVGEGEAKSETTTGRGLGKETKNHWYLVFDIYIHIYQIITIHQINYSQFFYPPGPK